jgi:hypothetical protein
MIREWKREEKLVTMHIQTYSKWRDILRYCLCFLLISSFPHFPLNRYFSWFLAWWGDSNLCLMRAIPALLEMSCYRFLETWIIVHLSRMYPWITCIPEILLLHCVRNIDSLWAASSLLDVDAIPPESQWLSQGTIVVSFDGLFFPLKLKPSTTTV